MTASEYDSSLSNLTEHKWSIYLWLNWKRKVNLKSTDKGESVHKSVALVVGGDLVALDLSDGQFSERCDVDGLFFNSDAIPILFGKA